MKEICPICSGEKYILIKGKEKWEVISKCSFCTEGYIEVKEKKNNED